MTHLKILFYLNFFCFGTFFSQFQEKEHFPTIPKVMLNHYSASDLEEIKNEDSLKFVSLIYYYSRSFILEKIDCEDCLSFDFADFDISMYENKRQENDNVTIINNKYGFMLTLIACKDLLHKLPIHSKIKTIDYEE